MFILLLFICICRHIFEGRFLFSPFLPLTVWQQERNKNLNLALSSSALEMCAILCIYNYAVLHLHPKSNVGAGKDITSELTMFQYTSKTKAQIQDTSVHW